MTPLQFFPHLLESSSSGAALALFLHSYECIPCKETQRNWWRDVPLIYNDIMIYTYILAPMFWHLHGLMEFTGSERYQKINKTVQLAPLRILGKLIFLLDFDARSIDPVLCQSNRVFSSLLLFFSCFLSVLNLCCSHGEETFEIKTFVLEPCRLLLSSPSLLLLSSPFSLLLLESVVMLQSWRVFRCPPIWTYLDVTSFWFTWNTHGAFWAPWAPHLFVDKLHLLGDL